MAKQYTQHYRLCQWAGTDKFMREEFNQDNQRVDTALRGVQDRVDRFLGGMEVLEYHVYNLMLQDYYDGKSTWYKKALLFDGFRDGSMISSLSGGLQRGNGLLTLQGTGMGDADLGYGVAGGTSLTSRSVTATGSASLQSFTFQAYRDVAYEGQLIVDYTLTLNGAQVATGSLTISNMAGESTVTRTVYFSPQMAVRAGDRFSIRLNTNSGSAHHFLTDGSGGLGGVFRVSSVSGQTGRMKSEGESIPACAGVLAWVRYKNGGLSLTLTDGAGGEYPMVAAGTRQTVNLQGAACTEAAFRLDRGLGAGRLTVLLDAALNGAATMEIYDYGMAFV